MQLLEHRLIELFDAGGGLPYVQRGNLKRTFG